MQFPMSRIRAGKAVSRPSIYNFRRLLLAWIILSGIPAALPETAKAADTLSITIDLSNQEMSVRQYGVLRHIWLVSTARRGYRTPVGIFRPYLLKRMHYSSRYDWAPMPFSIFFYKGYAIHGTTETRRLGRPVSHGCVRLHPDHARRLYRLVKRHGYASTRIRITW